MFCFEEEVTQSEDEVTQSEEEVAPSEEEVAPSEEEVAPSEEEVAPSEEEGASNVLTKRLFPEFTIVNAWAEIVNFTAFTLNVYCMLSKTCKVSTVHAVKVPCEYAVFSFLSLLLLSFHCLVHN